MNEILKEIEGSREKLSLLVKIKGISDVEVLGASQHLDKLINHYYKVIKIQSLNEKKSLVVHKTKREWLNEIQF